jgi:hypothetical protein
VIYTRMSLDIQQHLYHSFLNASTADVHVRVRGSWRAVYRLHRVVLIQSVSRAPRLHSSAQFKCFHRASSTPCSPPASSSPSPRRPSSK